MTTVWQGMPFMLLLLLAGLQSLPTSPFEAATVDGANAWQRFWYITLPLLRPVIVVAVALQTIDLFRVFDTIYIMTKRWPGPRHGAVPVLHLPVGVQRRPPRVRVRAVVHHRLSSPCCS